MKLTDFTNTLNNDPNTINFADTMACIEQNYYYAPSAFRNGELANKANENQGSCKLFSFAKLNNFNQTQTLQCFGEFYRDDVLKNPEGSNHGNIRNFMKSAWSGITFERQALISIQTASNSLETDIAADVFNQLLAHLDKHKEVQNIDLMILANFCRNCLAKWYAASANKKGFSIDYDEARKIIYGMPYSQWKEHHQLPATAEQLLALEKRNKPK